MFAGSDVVITNLFPALKSVQNQELPAGPDGLRISPVLLTNFREALLAQAPDARSKCADLEAREPPDAPAARSCVICAGEAE